MKFKNSIPRKLSTMASFLQN